jgi:hypothetical protein
VLSPAIIRYVLTAAVRDRLILAIFALVAVGASLAVFVGGSAITESDQFALVFAAGGLRIAGMLGLVLFAVFYVRRAFESKDADFILSRPVSRAGFLLSHAAAFSLLAVFMALAVAAILFLIAPHRIGAGHFLWSASLLAEFVIMVNAALFFALTLRSATAAAIATLGLYVLARIMGQLLGIIDSHLYFSGVHELSLILQAVSLIVPRLDLLAQTSWLVYGMPGDIGYGVVLWQGVVYTALLTAASLVDLTRRQF